jgi:DNA-binding transcriptional regulator LsrR (DeoR family)
VLESGVHLQAAHEEGQDLQLGQVQVGGQQAGWSQKAIAEALGVSKGAVSKWLARAEEGEKFTDDFGTL